MRDSSPPTNRQTNRTTLTYGAISHRLVTSMANFSSQRNVYKQFSRPFAKTFLMAVFTFQAVYYSWLKLESIEEKHNKEGALSTQSS